MSEATREIRTTCPYCGTGCGLVARVENGRLTAVEGDRLHPVNHGSTCQKPLRLPDSVAAADRATHVLQRPSADHRWEQVGWDAGIDHVAARISEIQRDHGADAVSVYISGQLLTEDYYAAVKLVKGFLGTNNLDSNSRLCMSSAVAGYRGSLGSDGPPPGYGDLAQADCMLVLGSNAAACHPIVWGKVRARQREGAAVIVVDPRRTPTAEAADVHLQVRPGSDLPLLNALLHVIERDGLLDATFVERHTSGIEQALAVAREWTPERAAEACGITAEQIEEVAHRFGAAQRAMALWSMGANQSAVGTLKNQALINLCLATGNIGRAGTGPLSLTGQPNAMGGRETGGLAHLLPGYRSVASSEHRLEMRRAWNLPARAPGISPQPGVAATELCEAIESGRVKAVWIVATNPVVSQPDAERFAAALKMCELVIVQDAFHPTETGALAHVLLPAAGWPEKDGTMTNSERRVSLVQRALDPPGEALPDWEIFARVGRALGHAEAFAWEDAAAVYDEYAALTAGRLCDVSALSHERLLREGPLQWPVPRRRSGDDHPGTPRLYSSRRFSTPDGRARLVATPHAEPVDAPSEEFPLVLTTGRVAGQWHTMTRTGKSPALLAEEPEPFVELHADDAHAAGLADGQLARVRSRRGTTHLRVRVSDRVAPGVAFAPFHWGGLHLEAGHLPLNGVTSPALDPTSKQPELKATAVIVEAADQAAEANAARAARAARSARIEHAEPLAQSAQVRSDLLVIGTGMAATATVEAALAHDPSLRVTMVGREPDPPYDRVALSHLLAGKVAEGRLALKPSQWFAERGVRLLAGVEVTALDLEAGIAMLARTGDGSAAGSGDDDLPQRLGFGRVVLATGSLPALPPIPGLDGPGVHPFRTLHDVRAILREAETARRAVVIGGGLLGIEAARALRGRGLHVTLVHRADRLMETQLDEVGARLLARSLADLDVVVDATTTKVGDGAVHLGDGTELPTDLVVVATGIRPETALARGAGLEVRRGIVVDDSLRASAPNVWAVGECAEHRGVVHGLWPPLRAMARAAGATIAGRPGAFHGALTATTLKVSGVDLFCAGDPALQPGDEELLEMDTRRGRYKRLIVRDGRLAGATLLGDMGDAPRLRELAVSGAPVPDDVFGSDADAAQTAAGDELVCSCQAVARTTIEAAIRNNALRTVEQVSRRTQAGTGCGGCRLRVQALLDEAEAETIDELREEAAAS
ncbi:molybdopterin-dependent oxidoreductase [Conexibacter stalactiti]|uniref:Molybdopterin-dependent oxidoreductase n=1 Tax=Conexibacter stalactiti TaxID=1940611 RepID=A0ABU4HL20_9ACTN|nr:molybdopterin-dependent oxidoreductase [Conexibacter stalactiti]MDW5594021.1 molybdopterin-dependent oxidoreductase [Conexibacter stalactiti]MEC5034663.1 molybdopterin-dependent oxidoreductase [Conexibacter stalactiti]